MKKRNSRETKEIWSVKTMSFAPMVLQKEEIKKYRKIILNSRLNPFLSPPGRLGLGKEVGWPVFS